MKFKQGLSIQKKYNKTNNRIIMKKQTEKSPQIQEELINRKEAIKKVGKYTAFTAASMMLLMSPVNSKAENQSVTPQKAMARPKRH